MEKSKNHCDQFKKDLIEQAAADDDLSSKPAHKLEDYVGYYEHSAYGMVQLKLENDPIP